MFRRLEGAMTVAELIEKLLALWVSTMIKNQVLTFRVDEATKHRIMRCLGWRYRSRTVFIRLVAEEGRLP
jgi:hypothetical protein